MNSIEVDLQPKSYSNTSSPTSTNNDENTIDPSALKSQRKRVRQACTTCQSHKMRCSRPNENEACLRCNKLGKECQLKQRSPRQSWVKKQESQINHLQNRLKEVEGLIGGKEVVHNGSNVEIHDDYSLSDQEVMPSIYPDALGGKNDDDRANYMLESINIFASIPMTLERLLHPESWLPS